jgi:hypothetical protein
MPEEIWNIQCQLLVYSYYEGTYPDHSYQSECTSTKGGSILTSSLLITYISDCSHRLMKNQKSLSTPLGRSCGAASDASRLTSGHPNPSLSNSLQYAPFYALVFVAPINLHLISAVLHPPSRYWPFHQRSSSSDSWRSCQNS